MIMAVLSLRIGHYISSWLLILPVVFSYFPLINIRYNISCMQSVMYLFPTLVVAGILVLFYAINVERHHPAHVTDIRTNVSYHGISNNGVDSFQNIHYGQDTGGAGRFAPPKPFIPARNSIINATAPGAACPQQL